MSKDYSQGKVYGIYFEDKLRYVGSTVLDLPKRMSYHRQDAKKESKKSLIYNEMKENGVENYYIELIELVNCNSKEELLKREGYFQRFYRDDILNQKIEQRTKAEWKEENKEIIAEKNKILNQKYRANHLEEIRAYDRERGQTQERKDYNNKLREKNKDIINTKNNERNHQNMIVCDCGTELMAHNYKDHLTSKFHKTYLISLDPNNTLEEDKKKKEEEQRQKNIEYHRKYREANKEELLKKKAEQYIRKKDSIKEYREKHKEEHKIVAKAYKEKLKTIIIKCPCGSEFNKNNESKHKKTKKHQDYLESLKTEV